MAPRIANGARLTVYYADTEIAYLGGRTMLNIFVDDAIGIKESFLSVGEGHLVLFDIFFIFPIRPLKCNHILVW